MDTYNLGYCDGMSKVPKRTAYTILDDDNLVKKCYLNGYYDGLNCAVKTGATYADGSPAEINDEHYLDNILQGKPIVMEKAVNDGNAEAVLNDPVNHPSHYCKGGIECLDAIWSSMSDEMFCGFLKGNVIKYIWRFEEKNKVEDLEKAEFYLKKLIDAYSELIGWQDK